MPSKKTDPLSAMAYLMKAPALDGFSMFMRPQARMAEALLKQNIETLDFLKTRFERDRAMLADLAQIDDPAKAMDLWSSFWQRMMSDYSTETTKLAASVTEIAEQAVRTATEEGEALMTVVNPSEKK